MLHCLPIEAKECACAGSRTRIDCLEGSHANRYTTHATRAVVTMHVAFAHMKQALRQLCHAICAMPQLVLPLDFLNGLEHSVNY